jgi:hypothetical protein
MKTLFFAIAVTLSTSAFAQGPGHQPKHIPDHPRVNQVNSRIDNQEKRINEERKEGELTGKQARTDRRDLRTINQEKHDMRSQDNGHLTRADQRSLNQQLNHNSRRIGH